MFMKINLFIKIKYENVFEIFLKTLGINKKTERSMCVVLMIYSTGSDIE